VKRSVPKDGEEYQGNGCEQNCDGKPAAPADDLWLRTSRIRGEGCGCDRLQRNRSESLGARGRFQIGVNKVLRGFAETEVTYLAMTFPCDFRNIRPDGEVDADLRCGPVSAVVRTSLAVTRTMESSPVS